MRILLVCGDALPCSTMSILISHRKQSVAALCVIFAWIGPVFADTDALLQQLRSAEAADAPRIERELMAAWSKSGSTAMDYLLKRGRDAMEVNDWRAAIEHLTALIDHAPDFAEAYHARAEAYFPRRTHWSCHWGSGNRNPAEPQPFWRIAGTWRCI